MIKWFKPWPLWCLCSALPVELSGQLGAGHCVGWWHGIIIGKGRRRRALVCCGRMASDSGFKPKTSTKLQVVFNPRFVRNYNEEWRVLRNQLIILVKIIKCKNHSSTPSIILLLLGYSSVYFDKGLMLKISASLSLHNGNLTLVNLFESQILVFPFPLLHYHVRQELWTTKVMKCSLNCTP